MSSPLLLPEIFSQILTQLLISGDTSSLARCLRCCDAWHNSGSPLLYRNVVLTNDRLSRSIEGFGDRYGHFVRSLTVSIEQVHAETNEAGPIYVEDEDDFMEHGSREAKTLWHLLEQLPSKIKRMKNMSVFSFVFTEEPYGWGFWMPGAIIVSILRSLPETCTSVEIDTQGHDFREPSPDVHVCDEIREMLPRLRHLRLRLHAMCPSLVGEGFHLSQERNDFSEFKPSSASLLETLSINYNNKPLRDLEPACVCPTFILHEYRRKFVFAEARVALIQALCLAQDASCYPAATSASLLHAGDGGECPGTREPYMPYNRINFLDKTAWEMPWRGFTPTGSPYCHIRLPDNQEIFGPVPDLQTIAENHQWVETEVGIRVPIALYNQSFTNYPKKSLSLLSIEAWRNAYPDHVCKYFNHDKTRGFQALKAKRRDVLGDRS